MTEPLLLSVNKIRTFHCRPYPTRNRAVGGRKAKIGRSKNLCRASIEVILSSTKALLYQFCRELFGCMGVLIIYFLSSTASVLFAAKSEYRPPSSTLRQFWRPMMRGSPRPACRISRAPRLPIFARRNELWLPAFITDYFDRQMRRADHD